MEHVANVCKGCNQESAVRVLMQIGNAAHHVTATRNMWWAMRSSTWKTTAGGRPICERHFGWLEVGDWVEVDHSGQPLHCFDESVSVVSVHVQYCILNYITTYYNTHP